MATSMSAPRKLWEHPSPESTQMHQFKTYLETQTDLKFPTFDSLYIYSCTHPVPFWHHTFHSFPLVYNDTSSSSSSLPNTPSPTNVFNPHARMDSIPTWFPTIHLNFAENVLFTSSPHHPGTRSTTHKEPTKTACTQIREGSFTEPPIHLSWSGLRHRVGLLSTAMRARGVGRGDRIAVVASNCIDTLSVFLAVTSLGGIFSSSSTDMGTRGILERLVQIRPRWVFVDDFAVYNGRTVDLRAKMGEVVRGMRSVQGFEGVVAQVRFPGRPVDVRNLEGVMGWEEYLEAGKGSAELRFERVGFSDPFLIVYSSGTTGPPKCLVHSVGGVVLNGHKEGRLHRCLDENSIALQVRIVLSIHHDMLIPIPMLMLMLMLTLDSTRPRAGSCTSPPVSSPLSFPYFPISPFPQLPHKRTYS